MLMYDGEWLNLFVNKAVYWQLDAIIMLGKVFGCEYHNSANYFSFKPNMKVIKRLKLLNIPMDSSVEEYVELSKPKVNEKLYPFQKIGVEKMLSMRTNILLADEMGLGKSVQVCEYLRLKENSLPALIVCPASLKGNWENEIIKWCGVEPYVIDGKKPYWLSDEFVKRYPIWIINYDVLGSENKEEKEKIKALKNKGVKVKKLPEVNGWVDEIIKHKFNTIILDEVQYISQPDVIRSRCIVKICKHLKQSKKIFVSGTPYETRTAQFQVALGLLEPNVFGSRWKFLMRYCDPVKNYFGWKFEGLSNADELHSLIKPFMIRRLKCNVLKELPPKVRTIVPIELKPTERKLYNEGDSSFVDDIENGKKNKQAQIGHLATLKQLAYTVKEKAVIRWIKDYLSLYDRKLVVFVYHKLAFHNLMKEFNGVAVGLNGETPVGIRQSIVEEFQNDNSIKLFIGQIKASGVGLTLTKANATCFVEFGNTVSQHEQAEDRVHRIGQEADSVQAYYLVLQDSVEQDIMQTLERRYTNIKQVMDNEKSCRLFEDDELKESVLKEYKKRKGIRDNLKNKPII